MPANKITAYLAPYYDFLRNLIVDSTRAWQAWSVLKKLLITLILLVVLLSVWYFDFPSVALLRQWADGTGTWFIFVFWAAYVFITQFPIPRTFLTLASGILFGPLLGILITLSATTVSAVISLLIVRRILGDWMTPRLQHPAVAGINERLRQRGWLAVGSLRMIAGIPFSILNYTVALTSVKVMPFAVATFVGSAPGSIATVFLGDTLTGQANPLIMMATIILACLGLAGLLLDKRLPLT
ncbi:TVP38/TMEM64 family protein [Corynebacterium caspium]|uniref:TVP38/TMEM64 family protein n=1 Tax=Corynebacterium caspium TaxID=234828 RepID=UPI00058F8BCD|nr:TVP38/TMEM64 family protein [Corynebacterium caspium]WKD59283.1 TVP38/TMEM64 family inner membrane protein YdjZ [Corynebacterium caspium DSM 44850]